LRLAPARPRGEIPLIEPLPSRALSHPTRIEILQTLQDRVASSSELSEQLGMAQGVVAYHAKLLVHCGCLRLVHEPPRRGPVESYFGPVA
jgi:predicted transcriptional regulator